MADALYAINSVAMLVVACLPARYWWLLPRDGEGERVRWVVLALVFLTLSDGIRYWWFAVYRIIETPPWMLDHWAVIGFTAMGTVASLMLLKLYGPGAIGWAGAGVTAAVAAVLYHFM